MKETELEKVYLAKRLPSDIVDFKHITIRVGDFFDSNSVNALKIRQKGDRFQLIKKEAGEDEYKRTEHTIFIKKEEFDILWKQVGQNHRKLRFFYPLGEHTCEIDYYKDRLDGYVRAEVEFSCVEDMESFVPPKWFGEEITKHNHEIHEDLGLVTFDEMKERFAKRNIELKKVEIPKKSKGVVLCIVFRKRDGKFLLLKRKKEKGGFWQPPSGVAERNESILDAGLRELFEETNIAKEDVSRLIENFYQFEVDRHYLTGEYINPTPHYVHAVEVNDVEVDLNNNPCDEHEEFVWVDYEEALGMLKWENNKDAFRKLKGVMANKNGNRSQSKSRGS